MALHKGYWCVTKCAFSCGMLRKHVAFSSGMLRKHVAQRFMSATAENANVIEVKANYTSQLLSYRDEIVFTDCSIREYFDEELHLKIDRDIKAAINVKRVRLDKFWTINRRKNKVVIGKSKTTSVSKEVLSVFMHK